MRDGAESADIHQAEVMEGPKEEPDAEVNDGSGRAFEAGRFGKAVEHLVAAACIVADLRLNVSTAFVDDEGVDLVFHQRGGTATLPVQVKARSSLTVGPSKGTFQQQARVASFRPRPNFYMLFVLVDPIEARIEFAWLVPSLVFDQLAATTSKGMRRITASTRPESQDQWRPYRIGFRELPDRLLAILREMEGEVIDDHEKL